MITTSVENGIEIIHCESAREFLDYLQIRDERWLPDRAISSPWKFRGHADADWKLEPSAMRVDWRSYFCDLPVNKDVKEAVSIFINQHSHQYSNKDEIEIDRFYKITYQIFCELLAVHEFIDLANYVGHPIPENNQSHELVWNSIFDLNWSYKQLLDEVVRSNPYNFVDPTPVEFALAQHHRIPTRLLDWTVKPFVAVYFAVEEIIQKNWQSKSLAIWAFNLSSRENRTFIIPVRHKNDKIRYLHAQGGLFLYDSTMNYHFGQNGAWKTLDKAITDSLQLGEEPVLRKIILPQSEAREVLRLLAAENITRAHLMPTYDNITETLKIQRLINKALE